MRAGNMMRLIPITGWSPASSSADGMSAWRRLHGSRSSSRVCGMNRHPRCATMSVQRCWRWLMTCLGYGTIPPRPAKPASGFYGLCCTKLSSQWEADRLCLVLHWQGDDHTRLEVAKNRTGQNRWKTDVETVQLIRELARMLPDHSIAPVLNRLGIRSAKGQGWTQLRVRNFRGTHQIAVYRDGERAERHELVLRETASRLGVHKMTVIRLIRDGVLPARQVCVGAPYVIREDDLDRPAVRRALANGRAVSPDPRQERMSFQ